MTLSRTELETLYCYYNRREYVDPDPLLFLYDYQDIRDREIVGLLAALLAYGRVAQIQKSVSEILVRIKSPRAFVEQSTEKAMRKTFADFRHRFTSGDAIAWLLGGVKQVLEEQGSLEKCFAEGLREGNQDTVQSAIILFADKIARGWFKPDCWILPVPSKGSACKRLHLFLRWMVRQDAVDPGGWKAVEPSQLILPLDTHIHRIGLACSWTRRKQADIRTACEITSALRSIDPEDPVKYDFALTRLGIRREMDLETFVHQGNRVSRN